jgi:alkylation response protein AidB-like acyl-CoA dehydrogenase
MDDVRRAMLQTARRVLGAEAARRWSPELWQELAESGLSHAALPAEAGGVGAGLGDLLALARVAGRLPPDAPLVEGWIAQRALVAAGLACPEGPLTVAAEARLTLDTVAGGVRASGRLARVPWGRSAAAVVLVTENEGRPVTLRIDAPQGWRLGVSTAKEPRDTLDLDGLVVPRDAVGQPGAGIAPAALRLEGALFRTLQMAGALAAALTLTVGYARDRVQFGKPIAKFQAVQQQIARAAAEVAAASAAAGAALVAAEREDAAQPWETACAKLRAGEAADSVTAIAHQVHAAMGFTQDYALQRSTTRLWAWRDEFGGETEWAAWIGAEVAKLGGDGLWAGLIDPPRVPRMVGG